MPDAQQREREARERLDSFVSLRFMGEAARYAEAQRAYRAAVRAARDEEIVAKVEGRIKDLREPDLRDDDRVRYAFAGRMASYAVVLEILRGLAAPAMEEG